MKRIIKKGISMLLCIVLLGTFTIPASAASIPFTDVSESDSYYQAVMFVNDFGLMAGTSPTKFSPSADLTRGAYISVLGRLAEQLGEKINSSYNHPFTDVSASVYYAKYVGWAWANGITSGSSATTFSPNKAITREEMAAITVNFCNHMEINIKVVDDFIFTDLDTASAWARNAITTCGKGQIILPTLDSRWIVPDYVIFSPKEKATRAVCAQTVYNLVSIHIS